MHGNRSFVRRLAIWVALGILPACGAAPEQIDVRQSGLLGTNGISAELVIDTQWGTGYCARVIVSNGHPTATTGTWSVGLKLDAAVTYTTWQGVFSGNTGAVTVTPLAQNAAIPPSANTQFGLCANIPTPGLIPILMSVASDLPVIPGGPVVAEYKFPAAVDAQVSPNYAVEIWASFYRPATLVAGRRYPLIVLMHGNHPTCGTGANPRLDNNNQYAINGTCPANYVVVNNHRGYDYLALDLAARGYFVVSINTNRGINGDTTTPDDLFIIGPRGRLLLRHLERLSRWNAGTEATPPSLGVSLANRIDFNQVGLFGHSRGGEGVRFAYNEYRRAGSPWPGLIGTPIVFRGVFEIGPTDELVAGQRLNATGTPWNVILPACDWDLRDLPGVNVFDRMMSIVEPTPSFKSFYHVWGTNHNYFNSEWQIADGNSGGIQGCIDHQELFIPAQFGSPAQRETGRFAAVSFFTANVGAGADRNPSANALFDTAFALPVSYRVNRGYHPGSFGPGSPSLLLEDFLNASGTSSYNLPNQTGGTITVDHNPASGHDASLRWGFVHDIVPSASTFFQSNFAPTGMGLNLTSYNFLDFRVDRSFTENPAAVAFRVQLVNSNNTLSGSVASSQFTEIIPPPRGAATLHTARIPLSVFSGAQLGSVRGVRFVFDTPFPGAGSGVFLGNIRATRATTTAPSGSSSLAAAPGAAPAGAVASSLGTARPQNPMIWAAAPLRRVTAGNRIERITARGADVEIVLATDEFFDLRASNLVLSIGGARSVRSSHPDGDLRKVHFLVPRAEFDALSARDAISVRHATGAGQVWEFGALDKAPLDR
jgi:cellulose binding protein with CBM2 domain